MLANVDYFSFCTKLYISTSSAKYSIADNILKKYDVHPQIRDYLVRVLQYTNLMTVLKESVTDRRFELASSILHTGRINKSDLNDVFIEVNTTIRVVYAPSMYNLLVWYEAVDPRARMAHVKNTVKIN